MPLVRIEIKKQQDPTYAKRIGQRVYAAMRSSIGVSSPKRNPRLIKVRHHVFMIKARERVVR